MRKVDARITETNTGVRRRQNHLRARLIVTRVVECAEQIVRDDMQGRERPDIADRIRALVRRTKSRPVWTRSRGVREGRERFDRVAENVEPRRCSHLRWHGPRVVWVEEAQRRLESPAGDARLRVHLGEVEDADACRLGTRSRRGRNRDERFQRSWHWPCSTDWRVHVVEKLIRRIRRVEIDCLRGVNHRAPAKRDDAVDLVPIRERDRVLERHVGWLDANLVVNDSRHARVFEGRQHRLHRHSADQIRVRHDECASNAEVDQIESYLPRDARTEADGRSRHFKRVLV